MAATRAPALTIPSVSASSSVRPGKNTWKILIMVGPVRLIVLIGMPGTEPVGNTVANHAQQLIPGHHPQRIRKAIAVGMVRADDQDHPVHFRLHQFVVGDDSYRR